MSTNQEDPVIPNLSEDGGGFPWNRSIWLTLALMIATLGILELSPLIPALLFKYGVSLLSAVSPGFHAMVTAHKQLITALLEEVLYLTAFGSSIYFLKRMVAPNKSLVELTKCSFASLRGRFLSLLKTAMLGWLCSGALVIALYSLVPLPQADSPAGDFAMKLTGPAFFVFAFGAIVLAPICEELLCRGLLFNMLRGSLRHGCTSAWAIRAAEAGAVLISGAFFSGMHHTLTGFPGLFVIGCVLAVVYRRRDTLYAPMFLHALNNLIATIGLYMAIHH